MITLTTKLDAHVAAYAPCVLAGTSSRDNVRANGTLIQFNVTGYQSDGGRLAVTVASSATDFEVDDSVMITGATGDLARYNGRHRVYSVDIGIITTYTPWSGGVSASVGQITRANSSLLVRADVYKGEVLLGSVYATPSTRAWSMDVGQTVRAGLSSVFTLTNGVHTPTGAAFNYTVRLFEQWQRVDYTTISQETTAGQHSGVVHRVTSMASMTTTALLNDAWQSSGKIVLHFMTDAAQVLVRFTPSTGAATTYNIMPTLGHVLAVYEIPASVKYVTVDAVDVDTLNTIKAPIMVKSPRCAKRIYYLNRYGGYSSVELVDYEVMDEVERVERSPVRVLEVVRGKSPIEARYNAAYLDGLADSPEVYDEQGRRVYLRTSTVVKWANETQLEVEYERDQLTML